MSELAFEGAVYRSMFEWLPLAVVLLDEQLRVMLANRATAELFGLSPKQMTGISILSMIPHEKLSGFLTDFGERNSKVIEIQTTQCNHRQSITLKITALPLVLPWHTRRAQSVSRDLRLVLFENVTQKVSLERQLIEVEKTAGMGQLAAGLAHELANPLTSMASNLLFVKQSLLNSGMASVDEALDTTLERLDDMQQLLSTLTSFARRPQVKHEALNLHELIRRSATFVRKEAESRGIQIILNFVPDVLYSEIDRRLTNQVFLNLFKNAMEAMPQGGRLEVRTRRYSVDERSTARAVVEIVDSGLGIDQDEIKKVFRPLYSTKPRGLGLGLPFCRQIVEQQGGEIQLASKKGGGTIVTLSLPLH